MGVGDTYWMEQAFQLALTAQERGEVPVGAVLVAEDKLVSTGYNRVIRDKDPTAHAEIVAIRQASLLLKNHRLPDTTLYVTLEPCPMCAGAMVHALIKWLVFAVRDFKSGAAGSVYNLLQGYPLNHQVRIDEGILESECSHLLSDFFQNQR